MANVPPAPFRFLQVMRSGRIEYTHGHDVSFGGPLEGEAVERFASLLREHPGGFDSEPHAFGKLAFSVSWRPAGRTAGAAVFSQEAKGVQDFMLFLTRIDRVADDDALAAFESTIARAWPSGDFRETLAEAEASGEPLVVVITHLDDAGRDLGLDVAERCFAVAFFRAAGAA